MPKVEVGALFEDSEFWFSGILGTKEPVERQESGEFPDIKAGLVLQPSILEMISSSPAKCIPVTEPTHVIRNERSKISSKKSVKFKVCLLITVRNHGTSVANSESIFGLMDHQ